MPTATPTRRRWFQVSIFTMLLLILAVALLAFGFREHHERLHAERALQEELALSAEKNALIADLRQDIDTKEREMGKLAQIIKRLEHEHRAAMDAATPQLSPPRPSP